MEVSAHMFKAAKLTSDPAVRASILRRQGSPSGRAAVGVIAALLAATSSACGGSGMGPSATPTDLSGTWSGVVGSGSGGGRALRVTWSATQTGNTISGPATVTTSPAVSDVTFAGTLSGTLTGTQLSLSYASSAGNSAGAPDCSVSGHGTGSATGTSISGQFDVSFRSCELLGLQAPTSDQLTLTKQ